MRIVKQVLLYLSVVSAIFLQGAALASSAKLCPKDTLKIDVLWKDFDENHQNAADHIWAAILDRVRSKITLQDLAEEVSFEPIQEVKDSEGALYNYSIKDDTIILRRQSDKKSKEYKLSNPTFGVFVYATFNPKRAVLLALDHFGLITLWDIKNGTLLSQPNWVADPLREAVVNGMLTVEDYKIRLRDEKRSRVSEYVQKAGFSKDGEVIVMQTQFMPDLNLNKDGLLDEWRVPFSFKEDCDIVKRRKLTLLWLCADYLQKHATLSFSKLAKKKNIPERELREVFGYFATPVQELLKSRLRLVGL